MSQSMRVVTIPDYGYRAPGKSHDAEYVMAPMLALCQELAVKRVLDVGCGNGTFCQRLVEAGLDVVGCDPSESGIGIARQHVPGARFENLAVADDPAALGDTAFDAAVAMEVVEHLYSPRELPRFARGALRVGGYLIVSTPYHGYLKNL